MIAKSYYAVELRPVGAITCGVPLRAGPRMKVAGRTNQGRRIMTNSEIRSNSPAFVIEQRH